MLILASTTDKLRLTTSSVADIDVLASYVDNASGTITPAVQATAINTATTTDIVAAPGSGVQRNVKTLNLRNKHATTANTLTVINNVAGTGYELIKVTLLAGQALTYVEGAGWCAIDTNGASVAQSAVPMTRVVLTAGSAATYTTPARCRAIDVTCIGGGGAGGGAATAASSGAAGAGGGSGSSAEKLIASPAATYTYTVGAGGTAGTAGNNPGNAGADSTFSTLTGKGGSGGAGMAAGTTGMSLGGAGGTIATGGDTNSVGQPGYDSSILTAASVKSGSGGPSIISGGAVGRITQGAGNSATANTGAGGAGGACVSAGSAVAGGVGGSGVIIVTEYY